MANNTSWLEKVKNLPPHTSIIYQPPQAEAEIKEYWTEERKNKAIPIPLPEIPWQPGTHKQDTYPGGSPVGSPIIINPNAVDASLASAPVPNPGSWPYSAMGKMFMTMNGANYVGTGFSVSGSNKVFMTAGHCVYDQDSQQWGTNVMLDLSYTPTSPGAQFAAVRLVTLCGWIQKAGHQYDIGGGVVNGDMFTGRGNLGLLFNQATNTSPWSAVGYPAGAPFPGNTMYQAVGTYIGQGDAGTSGMNNNDMTGGSSGGPWLVNANWGYVNGLQSYRYTSLPTNAYTPYFGTGAYNVWQCAVTGQCGC